MQKGRSAGLGNEVGVRLNSQWASGDGEEVESVKEMDGGRF